MYVGGQAEAEHGTPSAVVEDLLGVVTGFATATLESGKMLVSVILGVSLVTVDAQAEDTARSQALRARFTLMTASALLVCPVVCAVSSAAKAQFPRSPDRTP